MPSAGIYLCFLFFVATFDSTDSFIPTLTFKWIGITSTSKTHKEMTEMAIREVAKEFMDEFPDMYPDQDKATSSKDFLQAIEDFRDAVAKPDLVENLKNLNTAHFDDEKLRESQTRLILERARVISAITADAMEAARDVAGQLLHTLQDFYSHTTWIESGKREPYEGLGEPGGTISNVASPGQATCTDCNTQTCTGNVRNEILSSNTLTSGYVIIEKNPLFPNVDPASVKPAGVGKCSHGGFFDITSRIFATGGINKDSNAEYFSPHHALHDAAATVAKDATVAWLKSIRDVREDEEFARFIGLSVGASLCFVVDTTGSMGDEIVAVRSTTVRIVQNAVAREDNKPGDFVLVPFNDPSFGPVTQTTNSDSFIGSLNGLFASGGGDTPEKAFSGIRLALLAVKAGSTCFVYTDAPAKDGHLFNEVVALAVDKNVRINVIYSTTGKRKKRDVRLRRKRQTGNPFEDLARISGGQLIPALNEDIEDTSKIVDVTVSSIKVTLFQGNNLPSTGGTATSFPIYVDETVTDLAIQISTDNSIEDVEILNPSGATQIPGAPDSGAIVIQTVDSTRTKLYNVAAPTAGQWTLKVTSSYSFSVQVTGSSLISFTYQFVEEVDGPHGGYRSIKGRPMAGKELTIVANVVGGVDMLTGATRPNSLSSVSALVFVKENGEELLRIDDLFALKNLVEYQAAAVLPSEGFQVVMEGTDSKGNKVKRTDSNRVTSAVSAVNVVLDAEGSFSVSPGESINIPIDVTNTGSDNTYTLTVTDSLGYVTDLTPTSLLLATDETKQAIIEFTAPSGAALNQVASVTVTATAGSDQNFVVFRVAVISGDLDVTPPTCNIDQANGKCEGTKAGTVNCNGEMWDIKFTAMDSGTGLYLVRPSKNNTDATFTVASFVQGTKDAVSGEYSSDCCVPRVDIVASDLLGGNGHCKVDYIPIAIQPPVETGAPVSCRVSMWTMALLMTLVLSVILM